MTGNLQELKQRRLKWVEANRENGFDEGINRLLTDLYPDNAHFIYELLQNAEDPGASAVRFTLTDSRVEFEHDGQRLFNLADVESITSIGNSTKRDDPTSIGKFGVGFKAVFAYTNTPEIHSGDFHFRIRDLVVPEPLGMGKPAAALRKTRFVFPFDNPRKPARQAVAEVERGLRALGDNTLLFLSHIRKIDYTLPDGSAGSLERLDHPGGRIEIRATTVSHWLHFQKEVAVVDDDGKEKPCRVAIAYRLAEEEGKKGGPAWKIVPLEHGEVSIFFPAEKETSNLRFHLHAPFASTVARDSVRDCKANHQLRDRIAELVVESLTAIRDQGLLTVGFLAVLPNPADNLAGNSPFYEPIRQAVIHAFRNEVLTPTRSGSHAPATRLYRGPARIAEVLSDDDLSLLTNYEPPLWAANPPQQNQREDRFLDSLKIDAWEWADLTKAISTLDDEKRGRIENWFYQKEDTWLMRFYALLGEACSVQRKTVEFSRLRIVRVKTEQGDEQVIPATAFFPPTEGVTPPSNISVVKSAVYDAGRSDDQKRLAKLFLEKIGVRSFDAKEVIKMRLAYYDTQPDLVLDEYLCDVQKFVEYWQINPANISLFENHTFLRGKSKVAGYAWRKAHELYLDKPFMDTGLRNLFNDPNLQFENKKYEILIEYQRIPKFVEFSVALGVMDRLEIRKHDATAMQSDILRTMGRKTKTTEDEDYYINALNPNRGTWWHSKGSSKYIGEIPIYGKNVAISESVWKTVCRASPEELMAHYKPNERNRHQEKRMSAFFIKQLTNCDWVPDCNGNFLAPADLTQDSLHPNFPYDNRNGWLTAIGFGENARKRDEEYRAKNYTAQNMGFVDADRATKWAEVDKLGISPDEILAQRKRAEQPEESVPNPERRRKGVLERWENAPSKESVTRERSIQPGAKQETLEAKAYLRAKYRNAEGQVTCQCCGSEMPFKVNGDYYFEAVQCVRGHNHHYFENRLALCPTCAAMYQHAKETDDAEIHRLIVGHEADDQAPAVEIPVRLAGRDVALRFVGAHWFDLKIVLSGNSGS